MHIKGILAIVFSNGPLGTSRAELNIKAETHRSRHQAVEPHWPEEAAQLISRARTTSRTKQLGKDDKHRNGRGGASRQHTHHEPVDLRPARPRGPAPRASFASCTSHVPHAAAPARRAFSAHHVPCTPLAGPHLLRVRTIRAARATSRARHMPCTACRAPARLKHHTPATAPQARASHARVARQAPHVPH